MTNYDQAEDGDVITPDPDGLRLACCDCGLVHEMNFWVSKSSGMQFTLTRNVRATAAMRREMRKRSEKEDG